MSDREPSSAAPANVTQNGLLSALAQASVMIAGGINAVIIGARYPVSTATDSLFTAFAIYSIWTVVAASIRTALVPRLFDREHRFGAFSAALAALIWAVPAIVLVQLAIGIPLLNALSSGDTTIGVEALLIFCPAALFQLVIAVGAAMFAVLDDFAAPAKAFTLGGLVNVAAFLLLEPPLGLVAMPLAALASSIATLFVIIVLLRRSGWEPREERLLPAQKAGPWLATIVLGSAYAIGTQALYLISMIFATATLPVGSATIYTYAYMAIGLVIALSASSGAMALAAPVAESWRGDARGLTSVEDDVTRSMAVLMVGVAGVIATFGAAVAGPLLPGFTDADISELVRTATVLCLLALGSAVTIVPLVAMFTARRYGQIGVVTLASIPFLALLTGLLLSIYDSLTALALAASITVIALAWGILGLCHGSGTLSRIGTQIWQIAIVAVPGAGAYLLADQLLVDGGEPTFAAQFGAAATGTALLALYVGLALPSYRALLARMLAAAIGRSNPAAGDHT